MTSTPELRKLIDKWKDNFDSITEANRITGALEIALDALDGIDCFQYDFIGVKCRKDQSNKCIRCEALAKCEAIAKGET